MKRAPRDLEETLKTPLTDGISHRCSDVAIQRLPGLAEFIIPLRASRLSEGSEQNTLQQGVVRLIHSVVAVAIAEMRRSPDERLEVVGGTSKEDELVNQLCALFGHVIGEE